MSVGANWLPPAAQARMEQARAGGTWTSGLAVPEFAAIKSVGFTPVGQVMGSVVMNLGWSGTAQATWCGYGYGYGFGGSWQPARTVLVGRQGGFLSNYVKTVNEARRTAMARMAHECQAVGGDGVVSVTLEIEPFKGQVGTLEFQAMGTAVRADGGVRPPRPFTSHLSGVDFAKLLQGGWVPVDMAFGFGVGIRHDDYSVRWQRNTWSAQEVGGWSELVTMTRHDAHDRFRDDARQARADGAVLSSADLSIRHRACPVGNDQHDHIAEATFIGTAIAAFHPTPTRTPTLSIMRLS